MCMSHGSFCWGLGTKVMGDVEIKSDCEGTNDGTATITAVHVVTLFHLVLDASFCMWRAKQIPAEKIIGDY